MYQFKYAFIKKNQWNLLIKTKNKRCNFPVQRSMEFYLLKQKENEEHMHDRRRSQLYYLTHRHLRFLINS